MAENKDKDQVQTTEVGSASVTQAQTATPAQINPVNEKIKGPELSFAGVNSQYQPKMEFNQESKKIEYKTPQPFQSLKLDATPAENSEEDIESYAVPEKSYRELAEETINIRREGQAKQDKATDKRLRARKWVSAINDVIGGIGNMIAVGRGAKNIERHNAMADYNKAYTEEMAAREKRRMEDNLTRAEGVANDFKEARELQALAASRAAAEAAAKSKHDRDKELWGIRFQGQKDVEDVRGQNRIEVEEKRNEGKVNAASKKAQGQVSAARAKSGVDKETKAMEERGKNARAEYQAKSKVLNNPKSKTVGDVTTGIGDSYVKEYLGEKPNNETTKPPRLFK